MTSVLTNGAARIALQTLQTIQGQIGTATNRLSTGQRISTAADGAAYWAIATTLRADRAVLDAVKSGLSLGAASVDVTAVGLNATLDDLGAIRERLVSAMAEGADRGKLQDEIAALQGKIRNNAASASANGQNWLSVDSARADWSRFANFTLGAPRGADGTLSLQQERLDIASVALFDANTVSPDIPRVYGTELIDQIARLASSINASSLGAQVRATATGSDGRGTGTLVLEALDRTKTIRGSYQDGVAAPVAGTPVDRPTDRFGDLDLSYVRIPVSNLSAGDLVSFQVSGGSSETFTVTGEGDGIDFSGSNEIHLEIRPFAAKYPTVVYDVVVNGAVLASKGVTGLGDVTRHTVVSEIAAQIRSQYASLYRGLYPEDEVFVETYQAGTLAFRVNAAGPLSSIDVAVAAPTGANSLVDIGYGTAPGAARHDDGFQEPIRAQKGLLDTPTSVPNAWRTDLAGIRVPVDTTTVTLAGQGTAFRIAPETTQEQVQALMQFVDRGRETVMEAATRMGALKTRLSGQAEFLTILGQIQQSAIGALVDADIEAESVRLKALQVQQQLGIQSLSIANEATGTVVSLFR